MRSSSGPIHGPSPATSSPWATSVHPHARGDLWGDVDVIGRRLGPSPRAWGPLDAQVVELGPTRSIPTRVGTSHLCAQVPLSIAVHPHARGDLSAGRLRKTPQFGPSPRAWGPLDRDERLAVLKRSIPTRVGTSSPRDNARRRPTVHPHARGDLLRWSAKSARSGGPSPRAWGPLAPCILDYGAMRSIPTRVGTSLDLQELLRRLARFYPSPGT